MSYHLTCGESCSLHVVRVYTWQLVPEIFFFSLISLVIILWCSMRVKANALQTSGEKGFLFSEEEVTGWNPTEILWSFSQKESWLLDSLIFLLTNWMRRLSTCCGNDSERVIIWGIICSLNVNQLVDTSLCRAPVQNFHLCCSYLFIFLSSLWS